jgi:hypothetical protein
MEIRFIKLGNGGCWEKNCIEVDNTIRLGYESGLHSECIAKNWNAVRAFWLAARKGSETAASNDLNQIRDFYELAETDLWITFYKRKLYWCHAHKNVIELPDGTRERKVIGKWSCTSKTGALLAVENIDGRVTTVQGYRGTICGVKLPEYVLRKIEGQVQPDVLAAKQSLLTLERDIEVLVKGLWWKDFELLVELVFAKAGWQRVSVLGGTEKEIDLDVIAPVSNQRAFVQVKSQTSPEEIRKCHEAFKGYEQYSEMFMVFHTINGLLSQININQPNVHIWDSSKIASLVIHAGLVDWLIAKRT